MGELDPTTYPPFDGTPRAAGVASTGRGARRRHVGGGYVLPEAVRLWLVRRIVPSLAPDVTRTLVEAAHLVPDDLAIHALARADLERLTRAHGVDTATAILHHVAHRDPANGAELARFLAWDPVRSQLPRLQGRLIVIPSAFYEELPEFGGDGRAFRQLGSELGLDTSLVTVPGLPTLDVAADFVRHALAQLMDQDPEAPLTIVTISKGASELRVLLERESVPLPPRTTWVNVCGLVHGTELNRDLAERRAMRRRMQAIGVSAAVMDEYVNDASGRLATPAQVPAGMDVVNVVPLPMTDTVSPALRRRHAKNAAAGPNDGVAMTCDAILPRGVVVPLLHTDHYVQSHQALETVWRTLAWLGRPDSPHRRDDD